MSLKLTTSLSQRLVLTPQLRQRIENEVRLALGIPVSASLIRVVRTSMVEELDRDYVRTAHAKGLPDRVAITSPSRGVNPIVVQNVYERTSDVAEWNVYNGGTTAGYSQPGPGTASFASGTALGASSAST